MTELVVFEYEGEEVRFDPAAQMWNLNVMHRAAGSERSKEPSRWLNQAQTQDLLAALTEAETTCLNGSISVLVETREGRNGGTWALPFRPWPTPTTCCPSSTSPATVGCWSGSPASRSAAHPRGGPR